MKITYTVDTMTNVKDAIEQLQQALIAEGEKPGAVDGRMGKLTFEAAVRFQRRALSLTKGVAAPKGPSLIPPLPVKAGWRVAESLIVLRAQIDALYPDRNKRNDGTIGDKAHQSRDSDHNPWIVDGKTRVVSALDITHDPVHGCDCERLVELIKLDRRIKYIIFNKRIYNPSVKKEWRAYKSSNPHTEHMHISVLSDKKYYDDESPWSI